MMKKMMKAAEGRREEEIRGRWGPRAERWYLTLVKWNFWKRVEGMRSRCSRNGQGSPRHIAKNNNERFVPKSFLGIIWHLDVDGERNGLGSTRWIDDASIDLNRFSKIVRRRITTDELAQHLCTTWHSNFGFILYSNRLRAAARLEVQFRSLLRMLSVNLVLARKRSRKVLASVNAEW